MTNPLGLTAPQYIHTHTHTYIYIYIYIYIKTVQANYPQYSKQDTNKTKFWSQNVEHKYRIQQGAHKYSKNLEATSKFQALQKWYEASSLLKAHCTKFSDVGDLATGICAPLVHDIPLYWLTFIQLGWVFEIQNMVYEEGIILTANIKLRTKWHFAENKLHSTSQKCSKFPY